MGLVACGGTKDAEPSRSLVEDVAALQQASADDLVLLALDEVESAVADDLPARAARLLERGAIPAAERHAEAVEALTLSTDEGRVLRAEGARLLQARVEALELYQASLVRGLVEDDMAALEAIQAQRRAEEALATYFERLAAIRPLEAQ